MTYLELENLRARLRIRANHPWDDFAALGSEVLSRDDVNLLRSALVRTSWSAPPIPEEIWDGDNAGKAALALLTRAGYCDLASDIRPWLLGYQDEGDQIYTTGPHVLYQIVVGFGDGNALRVLLENVESANRDVQLNLSRVIEVLGDAAFDLLRATRRTQISAMLDHDPNQTSDRILSVLKSFVDETDVRAFLADASRSGRLHALRSLLCWDDMLEWSLFDRIRVANEMQAGLFLNAMLENVRRGADANYCIDAPALKEYSIEENLTQGLAIVKRQTAE